MDDITRRLAATLGRLQRSPGKDHRWMDKVLRALERELPQDYYRLQRQVGFAWRLGQLIGLDEQGRGAVSLGLFFHTLSTSALADAASEHPSRPWTEYLYRHGDWFAPALDVLADVAGPATEEEPDASLVARTALEFDTGTFVRNRSPLQMLHALREAAEGEAQTKVLEALLSEEGQELCIAHARGVRHRSVSVPKLLNEALQALKPGRPRVAVKEEVVAPTRISGRALGSGQRRQEAAREDVEATLRAAKSEAFDKRRQALRAGRSPKGLRFEGADGAHERPVQNGHDGRADAADDAGKQRSEEALGEAPHAAPEARAPESVTRPETPPDDLDIASEAPDVEPAAAEARDEEPVAEEAPAAETKQDHNGQGGGLWLPPTYHDAAPREEAPTMQTSAPDTQLAERVEALRARLEQIERSVAEAQQILSGLAPELEGLATWMEELESVVTRWKHGRVA